MASRLIRTLEGAPADGDLGGGIALGRGLRRVRWEQLDNLGEPQLRRDVVVVWGYCKGLLQTVRVFLHRSSPIM
jgi:hypothetical protein